MDDSRNRVADLDVGGQFLTNLSPESLPGILARFHPAAGEFPPTSFIESSIVAIASFGRQDFAIADDAGSDHNDLFC